VHRVDDGHVSVVHRFPDGEEPAGLGWLPNGDLLVAGMAKRVIYRVSGGRATVHADVKHLAPHQINDMVVTSDGTAFVTQLGFDPDAPQPTPQPTVVIRVGLDGTVTTAADDLMVPNGIAVDNAERSLVVAESGAARLTRFALRDGVLSDRVHESLPATAAVPFCAPDGICLDEQGARWVQIRSTSESFGFVTESSPMSTYSVGTCWPACSATTTAAASPSVSPTPGTNLRLLSSRPGTSRVSGSPFPAPGAPKFPARPVQKVLLVSR
jgi:sugar lactone lactonase YvrE